MLQILDLARPDLLAYRVTDVLTEEDVRARTDAFDALLDAHDTVHLYAEVEGLRGAEARALWVDLVYGLRRVGALRSIGRVALVTDAEWVRRLARLEARLLPIGRLHVYGPDGRGDARAWVLDAPSDDADGFGDGAWAPSSVQEFGAWAARGALGTAWADAAWFDEDFLDDDLHDDHAMGVPTAKQPRAPRFGHTVHRTHVLLRRVADELGTAGTAPAYHALRAVLHALRDRLPAAEAADLAAQLTTIVRGVFYQGYQPEREAEKADRAGFLAAVARGLRDDAPFDAEAACAAVGAALAASVSAGQWGQVLLALPGDVRDLFAFPVGA